MAFRAYIDNREYIFLGGEQCFANIKNCGFISTIFCCRSFKDCMTKYDCLSITHQKLKILRMHFKRLQHP